MLQAPGSSQAVAYVVGVDAGTDSEARAAAVSQQVRKDDAPIAGNSAGLSIQEPVGACASLN